MKLAEGSMLFARIDYKTGSQQETEQDAMDSMGYLQGVARERYLAAGIFGDPATETIDGAMILFEAKDMEEARRIADGDPIIQRGFYQYHLHQWNLMLTTPEADHQ